MSLKLKLYRHQWEPTGSGDAKSIQNAMGKTSLDLWSLLLRESLQNSWDARLHETIRFSIVDSLLSRSASAVLINDVFGELPPEGASRKLPNKMIDGRIRVLSIADYGTRGLGGPIRANFASKLGEKRDFVDLVRNFGRSHDKGLAGGTYGLGKGVLYSSSQVGMCLIYSQAVVNGTIENRLIGVSGGDADYDDGELKYTGRNWWGLIAPDGIVDPLTGPEARLLAENVGIPVPEPDETGTCILIIAPKDMEGKSHANASKERVEALKDAALIWAWPHAIDLGNGPDVDFTFSYDGVLLSPLRPLEEPLVKHFAQGYVELAKSKQTGKLPISAQTILRSIDSERPSKHLGDLVLRQALHLPGDNRQLQNTVALLRKPKMVVKYLPVTAPAGDFSVYSVFCADESVDHYLASSEPVAHDDWVIKEALKEGKRNYVRTILNKIEEVFKSLYSGSASATASQRVAGATKISTELGGLINGFKGRGTSTVPEPVPTDSSSRAKNGTLRRASIRPAGAPQLFKLQGQDHVAFPFVIQGGKLGEAFRATATAQVILSTGGVETIKPRATESPVETDVDVLHVQGPRFIGWLVNGEGNFQQSLVVETPTEDSFFAVFSQPIDTAIGSTATLEASNS